MERLTKHSKQTSHENGICCTHFCGPECLKVGGNCAMNCKWEEAVWSRLAAYEDTGLTPQEVISMHGEWCAMMSVLNSIGGGYTRLRELAEADKDGRLVVLPCKVGDTVYFRTYDCNGKVDLGIQPHKVTAIVGYAIVRGRYTDVGLSLGPYGVSWFLTREEAEKALEAMKDGNG